MRSIVLTLSSYVKGDIGKLDIGTKLKRDASVITANASADVASARRSLTLQIRSSMNYLIHHYSFDAWSNS